MPQFQIRRPSVFQKEVQNKIQFPEIVAVLSVETFLPRQYIPDTRIPKSCFPLDLPELFLYFRLQDRVRVSDTDRTAGDPRIFSYFVTSIRQTRPSFAATSCFCSR